MELLYPDDYNRITRRLHNKYAKILSRKHIDIESRFPKGFLNGFEGDSDWIIDRRLGSANFSSIFTEGSECGGIIIFGIDMGHGIDMLFSKCVQPNMNLQQRNILRNSIGITGDAASNFLANHSSSLGQIPTLVNERLRKTMKIAINIYWTILVEDYPWLNQTNVDPDYQTVILSFLMDHGFSEDNKIAEIMTSINNDQRAVLAHLLYKISKQNSISTEMSKRRCLESSYLLKDIFPLTGTVGQGCENHQEDLLLVCEKLTALGFADSSNAIFTDYTYSISDRLNSQGEVIGWNVTIGNNFNQPDIIHFYDSLNTDRNKALSSSREIMDQFGESVSGIDYPPTGKLILPTGQHNLGNDFSIISKFKELILGGSNLPATIYPGDATHLWLCSDNLPKMVVLWKRIRKIFQLNRKVKNT